MTTKKDALRALQTVQENINHGIYEFDEVNIRAILRDMSYELYSTDSNIQIIGVGANKMEGTGEK